jgi:multiple sugar transport system substrate-binding protein
MKTSYIGAKSRRQFSVLVTLIWMGLTATSCSHLQSNSVKISTNSQTPQIGAKQQRFDHVTLNVVTLDKPIGVAVEHRVREFELQTGAKVNMTTVPFGEVYNTMWQDFTTKENKYDVMVFIPQWIADFADGGYFEDLTQRVAKDTAIQWDDIAPFFRNFGGTYEGRIYAIPIDGDFHMVYYRSDLLEKAGLKPPSTWDEYLNIAKKFDKKDLNNDNEIDYGSCIPQEPNHVGYWMFWSIASAFLQSKGTQQGSFFDPNTMEPLVNNEAFAKALDIYKEIAQYEPANALNLDLTEMRHLFMAGRCALTIDWGDTGTLAIEPNSQVTNKVGAVILPGTTEVLDRVKGKLVSCDKFLCPYTINGINHAPYAALGGWAGAINKSAKARVKEAGYALISYISSPPQSNVDVTIGATGFNPYRISQFTNREIWLKAGMSPEAATKYLGGIGVSLSSPNIAMDLRIPQNNRYQREVLDPAIADFLRNRITREETMQQIETGWEKLNIEIGKNAQNNAYRASLGLSKK